MMDDHAPELAARISVDEQTCAAATVGYPRVRLHSVPQREARAHWVWG
ncbi:MAG: hypothetical protein LJF30_16780 [Acidobacteria bacterium]|jgi:hypothetical protein|nr:hypothetical protein [Acidobacteriota bacterium]